MIVSLADHVCVQIGITFTGQIVLYTGLHWGVSPDNLIWRWTEAEHPLHPEELVLGDGIYRGNYRLCSHIDPFAAERQVLTKHCGYELFLTDDEVRTNGTIGFYRQRVEQVPWLTSQPTTVFSQVIQEIKDHGVFRGHFRGGTPILHAVMRFAVHATAAEMRLHPKYEASCGPWKHW
jgi:hypothetical protein